MTNYYTIKETVNATGYVSYISVAKHTSRGWTKESKKFKTEKAAKSWITRREKELAGTCMENTWSYEIVKC